MAGVEPMTARLQGAQRHRARALIRALAVGGGTRAQILRIVAEREFISWGYGTVGHLYDALDATFPLHGNRDPVTVPKVRVKRRLLRYK